MSATPDIPLSLREARRLEAEAQSQLELEATNWGSSNRGFIRVKDAMDKLHAARRATDEALLAAFLEWFGRQPFSRLELLGVHGAERTPDWSAVLDAVEREETER